MNKNHLNSQGNWDNAVRDQKFFQDIIDPHCKEGRKQNHCRFLSGLRDFRTAGSLCSFLELSPHEGKESIFLNIGGKITWNLIPRS